MIITMENKTQMTGKPATESIGITEMLDDYCIIVEKKQQELGEFNSDGEPLIWQTFILYWNDSDGKQSEIVARRNVEKINTEKGREINKYKTCEEYDEAGWFFVSEKKWTSAYFFSRRK